MGLKNKALLSEGRKGGKIRVIGNSWYRLPNIVKDPLSFANSDELQKLSKRNSKRK